MLGQNCAGDGLSVSIYGSRKAVGCWEGQISQAGLKRERLHPVGLAFRSTSLKLSSRGTQKNDQQGCVCVVVLVWAAAMGDGWDWVLAVVCPTCPGYG